MHYSLLFLSKEFPTDAVIEAALKPFNSEDFYERKEKDESLDYPTFTWDWWQVGGRYNGLFKLKFDYDDQESVYRWAFMAKEPRTRRLFRSFLLEEFMGNKRAFFFEDDYFASMGARDGFIYVDGGKIADLVNFKEKCTKCFCFLDADGNAFARKHWAGEKWEEDTAFDDKVKGICENVTDGYATIIDLHD